MMLWKGTSVILLIKTLDTLALSSFKGTSVILLIKTLDTLVLSSFKGTSVILLIKTLDHSWCFLHLEFEQLKSESSICTWLWYRMHWFWVYYTESAECTHNILADIVSEDDPSTRNIWVPFDFTEIFSFFLFIKWKIAALSILLLSFQSSKTLVKTEVICWFCLSCKFCDITMCNQATKPTFFKYAQSVHCELCHYQ